MREDFTDKNFTAKIGEQVRRLRHEQHLSRENLAEKADLTETGIAYLERGEKSPNIQTLRRVVRALGTTLWQFFAVIDE